MTNSTMATPEAVPASKSTSTAADQDPTHSKASKPGHSSTTVTTIFNSAFPGIVHSTTTSAINNPRIGLETGRAQTGQSGVPVPVSSCIVQVPSRNAMPQSSLAVGGAPKQVGLLSDSTNQHLGGLLGRTSQLYPFGLPQVSGIGNSNSTGAKQVGGNLFGGPNHLHGHSSNTGGVTVGNPSLSSNNPIGQALPVQGVSQGNQPEGINVSQSTSVPV